MLALPMHWHSFGQSMLLLRGHEEQTGAVGYARAPQHWYASCEKLTKALAMKVTAMKNLQSW